MKRRVNYHNHKYIRVLVGGRRVVIDVDNEGKKHRRIERTGGYEVYRCVYPGCGSFVPTELAPGVISTCWKCGEELVLTLENIHLKKPTHIWCRKKKVVAVV